MSININNFIEGKNAIYETIVSGFSVKTLYVLNSVKDKKIDDIIKIAKEKRVVIKFINENEFEKFSNSKKSQGIIAEVLDYKYCELNDILDYAKEKNEAPFILILDEIEDPHNFGAIIRTACESGVHGIIIKNRNQVQVTKTVIETSSGAINYVKIARVNNISNAIEELKKNNIFVYCATMEGENIYKTNLTGPIALVVGNEGNGVSKLVKERCDSKVSIPQKGLIDSLNVSVASAVIIYEIVRQRMYK